MSDHFDQPRPDEVARSERFIAALANREPLDVADHVDDRELAALFEDWRDALRAPARRGCSEQDAAAALDRGLAARRHVRRRTAVLSATAAVVLGVAGFGAVLDQAGPGDTLYGVRAAVFGEPASAGDEIAVSAEADLDQVEQLIAQGQWDQAQHKLAAVGVHLQTVKDVGRKQGLIEKVNRLNAKVVNRDPRAMS
jgi:hypothetical protein